MLENTCTCSNPFHMQYHKLVKLQQKSCRKVPNLIFYPLSQIEDLGVYELATTAISCWYYHSGAQSKLNSTLHCRHLCIIHISTVLSSYHELQEYGYRNINKSSPDPCPKHLSQSSCSRICSCRIHTKCFHLTRISSSGGGGDPGGHFPLLMATSSCGLHSPVWPSFLILCGF